MKNREKRCSLRSPIFIAQRPKRRQNRKIGKGRCAPNAQFAVLCHLFVRSAHPPTRRRGYSLPLLFCLPLLPIPFVDSILSTLICRLDSVDSDLSTRFCRLDYVDSSVDFENNSPQCRSAALGEAIATPISAARHRSEASKFFRKNAPLLCAFSRKNVRCLRPCRFLASKVLLSCYHRALLHCCIEYAIRRHISRPPNADTTQKKTCRR